MISYFKDDEGHFFSEEDLFFYIKWKVQDLTNQEYSDSDILNFHDNEIWHC